MSAAIRRPGAVIARLSSAAIDTQRLSAAGVAARVTRRCTTAHSMRWCVTPYRT
jgi:hypothetical protein